MWIITKTKKRKQSPHMRKRDCNLPLIDGKVIDLERKNLGKTDKG